MLEAGTLRQSTAPYPTRHQPYAPGWLLLWESPLWSSLFALAAYSALTLSHAWPWSSTRYAYYNFLADALLHGQAHLRLLPPTANDLVIFNGFYYLYWPPFPAVLLVPFVALFGTGFSDILFTTVVGSLNVALVALLLRKAQSVSLINLTRAQRALLVLFFALGTVHVTLAPQGRVWETGQLVGFGFVALTYLAAIGRKGPMAFLLAGLAMAAATMTRNHLILAGIWPAWHLLVGHRSVGWPRLLKYCLIGALPVVLAVLSLGLYNWARFGNALDVGLAHHQMSNFFREEFSRYGAFNLHYLPTNLYFQTLAYPFGGNLYMGGSLFLLSPVWLGAAWGLVGRQSRKTVAALLLCAAAVDVPILLLMGTGWVQFGSRYTLDFTVPLLLATAMGVRHWPLRVVWWLTAVSVVHFLVGTVFLSRALS